MVGGRYVVGTVAACRVLDANGRIVATNPAWRGLRVLAQREHEPTGSDLGARYFDAIGPSMRAGSDELRAGIEQVLEGDADSAEVEITGLRNPCVQIDRFQPGLMRRMIRRDATGTHRRAGVMAVVIADGVVRPGDAIHVELPAEPHEALPVL